MQLAHRGHSFFKFLERCPPLAQPSMHTKHDIPGTSEMGIAQCGRNRHFQCFLWAHMSSGRHFATESLRSSFSWRVSPAGLRTQEMGEQFTAQQEPALLKAASFFFFIPSLLLRFARDRFIYSHEYQGKEKCMMQKWIANLPSPLPQQPSSPWSGKESGVRHIIWSLVDLTLEHKVSIGPGSCP